MVDATTSTATRTSDWSAWLRESSSEWTDRMELKQYAERRARDLAREIRMKELQRDHERIREGEWPVISRPSALGSALGAVIDHYL